MIEISESQLKAVLANPAAFYEMLTNRKGYVPKVPLCDGDNELLLSDVAALGCLVGCVIVHKRREAFLLLLSSGDIAEFRDRLSDTLTSMNTSALAQAITGER
jgi:hypothetical protein